MAGYEAVGSATGVVIYLQAPGPNIINTSTPRISVPYSVQVPSLENTTASFDSPGLLSTGEIDESMTGPAPGAVAVSMHVVDVNAPTLFTADSVAGQCTAQASGTSGSVTLENASVAGVPVPDNPAPNTTIDVPGIAVVTLNNQVMSGDGSLLQVKAVEIDTVPGSPLGNGYMYIGQFACGATDNPIYLPVGALGGLLLTCVLGAVFTVRQLRRRLA